MKRVLLAVMAVAVSFSDASFADEEKKDKKAEKGGHVIVYGDDQDGFLFRIATLTRF